MAKTIGPSFVGELAAAGLGGLPFSWSPDGTINNQDIRLTQQQKDGIQAVYNAHNPALPAPPAQHELDRTDALAKAQSAIAGGLPELKAFVSALVKLL